MANLLDLDAYFDRIDGAMRPRRHTRHSPGCSTRTGAYSVREHRCPAWAPGAAGPGGAASQTGPGPARRLLLRARHPVCRRAGGARLPTGPPRRPRDRVPAAHRSAAHPHVPQRTLDGGRYVVDPGFGLFAARCHCRSTAPVSRPTARRTAWRVRAMTGCCTPRATGRRSRHGFPRWRRRTRSISRWRTTSPPLTQARCS